MNKEFEPLFTPWKIKNLEIKNRVVMTSMGGTSLFGWMEPAHFDKEAANFILERAKNNVGLILPGIAPIKNPMMGGWLYSNKGMYRKLKTFMDTLHKETDSKLFVQLTAGFGRSMAVNALMAKAYKNKFLKVLLKPIFNVDYLCASASATPNRWDEEIIAKPLTKKQIEKMVEAFAKTAKLCKDAGVDGIEVHAVHEGYLLDQFTMKYTNQRTDEYGGSFEGRYKFPVDIVKAIKKVCGEDYPVSLRYSVVSKTKGFQQGALPGEKYVEVGRDMEESERAAKYLQDAGYDMLNCDNGTYDAWYWAHPPGYMPENCNLADVEHIRKFVDIPVVCAGKMTPEAAAKSIKAKKIDAMGVARQFLVDPEWVSKLLAGKENDIHPCIHCHNGCFNMCHYKGVANDQTLEDSLHMARCALNPMTMQTKKYKIVKAKHIKNVAVIGAGIGGLESALVLAKRGHNVTVYEKSDKLGGIFIAASALDFKDADKRLLAWYAQEIKKYPSIKVVFNKEIKSLEEIPADEYIVATGSHLKRIPIKGFDQYAVDPVDVLLGKKDAGKNPVIIGGGLSGCELAYGMVLDGKKPTIIELKNDLVPQKGICLANSSFLREALAYHKVPVYLETSATSIEKDLVSAVTKDNKKIEIPCSGIINCLGYKPQPLFEESKHVHLVGDCYQTGNLRTVIWRAWDVAMKI